MTTRWKLTDEASSDLERLTDFLLASAPEAALDTVHIIPVWCFALSGT